MRQDFVIVWVSLGVAVTMAWVATRRGTLGLGRLVGSVGSRRAGRVALWLGWAWLGWHFLAR
jgi:hypothetical protein